jgi:hypothetical protein
MISTDEGIQIDFNPKLFHNFASRQDNETNVPNRPSKQPRDDGNPPSLSNPQQPFTSSFHLSPPSPTTASTRKTESSGERVIA